MPGLLTKYHRVVMPRFGETLGTVAKGTRTNRAHQIKTLRNQVGRKKARSIVLNSVRTHVRGAKEAERVKKVAAFKAKHKPTVTQSPRWRKRGGGKVTVRKLAKLPKSLVKKS